MKCCVSKFLNGMPSINIDRGVYVLHTGTSRLERKTRNNHASIYVVRKIRASIAEGEQLEKPIITPCSAIAEMRTGHESKGNGAVTALSSGPDNDAGETPGSGTSSEAAVQKCGS
ncbi:uncharacterized protein V6R79_009634 [Siganus canaliculatus]